MTRRLQPGTRLVIATHNPGKLREMDVLLRPFDVAAVSAGSLGLPEPEEDAPDFAGNARIKAQAAATATGEPALADDSGFCVAALGGAPGVLSARWAGPSKDFAVPIARILREITGSSERRAWFISALSLAWPDGETATFIGRVDGTVPQAARGTGGFGYDPIFVPDGAKETFGEMASEAKAQWSHRARALAQLRLACLPTPHLPPCFADAAPRSSGDQRLEAG